MWPYKIIIPLKQRYVLLNGSEARACPGVFLFKYAQPRLIVRFRRSINDVFRVDEGSVRIEFYALKLTKCITSLRRLF
jgi:hypothetical protein